MTSYRLLFVLVILFFTLPFLASTPNASTSNIEKPAESKIGFHFYKSGKIYDEAYQGIIDGLNLSGLQYETKIYRSARNKKQAIINLREMDSLGLDAIVSFSSAGTRIAAGLGLKTPILSSVINHPITIGIVQRERVPRTILGGTSYYVDVEEQLALYLQLFGIEQKAGMIYDQNNPAGYLAEEPLMRAACKKKGIEFVSLGSTGIKNLQSVTRELLQQGVTLVIIPTNLQIYNNLDLVLQETNPQKIPVVSMNKQGVEAGALAALYADTYKNGRQMIKLIEQVIARANDMPQENIPFHYAEKPDLIINLKAAMALGYEFEPAVLSNASVVLN